MATRAVASVLGAGVALAALVSIGLAAAGGPQGDAGMGQAAFEKCSACHTFETGHDEQGPNLAGIFGRKIAAVEGYRYSAAMKRSAIVWNAETLDALIEDPQALIPGNRMAFDGIKDKKERDDLLAYMQKAAASH